ncbi:hypothetical protein SRHO_G00231830 [Serrasalmus rhombeus]
MRCIVDTVSFSKEAAKEEFDWRIVKNSPLHHGGREHMECGQHLHVHKCVLRAKQFVSSPEYLLSDWVRAQ